MTQITPGLVFMATDRRIDDHYHIIVSDPAKTPDMVIRVSISTCRDQSDDACVLTPQDVRFLMHRSYVAYEWARHSTLDEFTRLFETGLLLEIDHLPPNVLARVQRGALKSPYTRRRYREVIATQLPDTPQGL